MPTPQEQHNRQPGLPDLTPHDFSEDPHDRWKKSLHALNAALKTYFRIHPADLDHLFQINYLKDDWDAIELLTQLCSNKDSITFLHDVFQLKRHFTTFFNKSENIRVTINALIGSVHAYLELHDDPKYVEIFEGKYKIVHARMFADVLSTEIGSRADVLNALVRFIRHPEIFDLLERDYSIHQSRENNRLRTWSLTFGSTQELELYLQHPRRAAIESATSLASLVNTYTTVYDNYRIPPVFWLDYPPLLRLVNSFLESLPEATELPWGDRMILFHLISSALGRHGVTETELLSEVFVRWEPNFEQYLAGEKTFKNIDAAQISPVDEFYFYFQSAVESEIPVEEQKYFAFELMSVAMQKEFLHRIKNGDPVKHPVGHIGLSAPGLQADRKRIRQRKGIPEALSASELTLEAERLNWLEDPFHPLYDYTSQAGFEVEAPWPAEINDLNNAPSLYRVYGKFGFRNGNDSPIEFAPDPARRPETVMTLVDNYINSGLLDIHEQTTLSGHLNLEINGKKHMALIMRAMYLCGIGCHPIATDEMDEAQIKVFRADPFHTVNVTSKESEANVRVPTERRTYYEGKGFRLVTADDFKLLIRLTMPISSAAKQYENALMRSRGISVLNYRTGGSVYQNLHLLEMTADEIMRIQDPTAKAMATIWHNYMAELNLLTTGVNFQLEGYWAISTKQTEMVKVGNEVRDILPTPYDHDDPESLKKSSSAFPDVYYDGQSFPNILMAARYLHEKCAAEVNLIYAKHLANFRKELLLVFTETNRKNTAIHRNEFLERKYGKRVTQMTNAQRKELIEKLKFRLIDDPELKNGDYNIPS